MSKTTYRQREAARRATTDTGYGIAARRDKAVKVVALVLLIVMIVSILPVALASI